MPLICVCSPKGGVGKTTLAANIAHGLHQAGRRVLALDLDPQNALRLHFGMPLGDGAGFIADLPRRPDWRAALRRTSSGVLLLPHGALDFGGRLALSHALERDPELLGAPLREMLKDPDQVVIVDTPPGISLAMSLVLPQADILLVPLLADGGSIAMLPDVESGRFLGQGTLGGMLAARLRIVLNQVDPGARLSGIIADALLRRLGTRLLGLVARDEAVAEALASAALIAEHAPRSRAAQDLAEIVRRLEAALSPVPAAMAVPAGILGGMR